MRTYIPKAQFCTLAEMTGRSFKETRPANSYTNTSDISKPVLSFLSLHQKGIAAKSLSISNNTWQDQ